jgi:uncharacterized protein YggT (Ycf19 family)
MLSTLIHFFASFINILAELIGLSMFAYALMSWFATGRTPLGNMLVRIVDPIIRPFRWARIGNFDLSFIVAYLFISFGSDVIVRQLYLLAGSL